MGRMLSALKQIESREPVKPRRVEPISPPPEDTAAAQPPANQPAEQIEHQNDAPTNDTASVEPPSSLPATEPASSPVEQPEQSASEPELPKPTPEANVQDTINTLQTQLSSSTAAISNPSPDSPPTTDDHSTYPALSDLASMVDPFARAEAQEREEQTKRAPTREATPFEHLLAKGYENSLHHHQYQLLAEKIDSLRDGQSAISLLLVGCQTAEETAEVVARTAVELASRNVGRVLTIDADRSPHSLTHRLLMEDEDGLTDMLMGGKAGWEPEVKTMFDHWYMLPAGRCTLTGEDSGRFVGQILSDWKERYSILLVAGGKLRDPLTASLARACDAAYLLACLGRTETPQVSRTLQQLRTVGARLLGCVALNAPLQAA